MKRRVLFVPVLPVTQSPDAVRALEERLARVRAPDGVTLLRDRVQRRVDAPAIAGYIPSTTRIDHGQK